MSEFVFHPRPRFPRGFRCASRNVGLKPKARDLALFASSADAAASAVFTRNQFPGAPVILEPLDEDAARERLAQIADYFDARKAMIGADTGPPYKPLPPDRLYLSEPEWRKRLGACALARLTPFAVPDQGGAIIDIGARTGRNFAAERADGKANVFEAVARHAQALQSGGRRVIVALWSEGARERMRHVLADHGLANLSPVGSWPEALRLPAPQVGLASPGG